MQQATFQWPPVRRSQPEQARRVLPGHEPAIGTPASNDDVYRDEGSVPRFLLTIAANTIAGALLLGLMFVLPYVVAAMLG